MSEPRNDQRSAAIPFIDCHVHAEQAAPGGAARTEPPVPSYRARGAEAVVLIEPLDQCVAAAREHGPFVIPVARIDMDRARPRVIRECLGKGCRGIKFINPRAPYGDRRYWPLYEALQEAGSTAVFHTGYLTSAFATPRHPGSMEYMRAAQVDVVARRFPRLSILMAHFSNPWWEEGWKVMWSNPNVHADLSGGTAIHRSLAMWAETFAPNGGVHESIERLCFATDVTVFDAEGYPFDEYVSFYTRLFDRIGLDQAARDRVMRGNARRLFGIPG
jgi:uncharacterized protein